MIKTFYLLVITSFIMGCSYGEKRESAVNVSNGRVERIENFDSKFIKSRNIDVWLPDAYSKKKEYSVLYMHDGQMLFDSSSTWNGQDWGVDDMMGQLIEEGKIRETIVVGVWNNERRHAEYFPQRPFEMLEESYRDSLLNQAKRSPETALFAVEVQSDKYLKFLVEELKPFIDKKYSTKTNKEETFVAGSSMGGLISLYAICEYPEVFGGAGCLSTHWIGIFEAENNPIPSKFIEYMRANLPSPDSHRIYFDFGTETLDAFYEPFQMQADEVMREKGYNKGNWITKKFEGHNHSENAWKSRLDVPFTFLLGEGD